MVKHQRRAVRKVMDMSLFVLFLLSGILCSTFGLWRDYYYINKNMTWSEAQSYCRERFTDLATVDSVYDVNSMVNIMDAGYSGSVWIGLKRATQSRWGWSMGDDALAQYSNWGNATVNNSSEEGCVFSSNTTWYTTSCSTKFYFLCYNETGTLIIGMMLRNWTAAQSYCRKYHVDLFTVDSSMKQMWISDIGNVWIGLFLDSWQWSDQWSLFFRNWATGYPSNSSGSGDCVAMSKTTSGKWAHENCDLKHPFFCHGSRIAKRQMVRFNLTCHGECNLSDSSLQTDTMNKINEKMKILGLGGYDDIIWTKDEGEKVFHMEVNTVQSKIKCDEN